MLGTTSPLRGTARVDRSIATVKVKKGARKRVRLSLESRKKTSRLLKPKLPGSRRPMPPTSPSTTRPSGFSATRPRRRLGVPQGGQDHARHADHRPPGALKAACDGVIVEREKLNVILAEQALQHSSQVDPSSRVALGKIIAHNKEVTGTISGTKNDMTITSTVTPGVSGRSRSVTHHGTEGFFALEVKLSAVVLDCFTSALDAVLSASQPASRWSNHSTLEPKRSRRRMWRTSTP